MKLMRCVGRQIAAMAVFVCAINDPAAAQSFYDKITEVARTPVQKKPATKPASSAAAHGQAAVLPAFETKITASAPAARVRKEEGYHFTPQADKHAAGWPNSEVQIARARCTVLLKSIAAEFVRLDPIKEGSCGDPAPVKLVSIGTNPKVTFEPAAVVNCDMVKSLHDWVVKDLQPLARARLKSPIVTIETMSSYSCRNAYGRRDARLSEHGRANAMDIRGFITRKSAKTQLMAHWGPTKRDLDAARMAVNRSTTPARVAARATRPAAPGNGVASRPTEQGANAALALAGTQAGAVAPGAVATRDGAVQAEPDFRPSMLDGVSALAANIGSGGMGSGGMGSGGMGSGGMGSGGMGSASASAMGMAPSRLGGPAVAAAFAHANDPAVDTPSWPVLLVSDTADVAQTTTSQALFLREAHRTACVIFGTVLGPEANQAHRNHFHVDLAQRGLGNYCR